MITVDINMLTAIIYKAEEVNFNISGKKKWTEMGNLDKTTIGTGTSWVGKKTWSINQYLFTSWVGKPPLAPSCAPAAIPKAHERGPWLVMFLIQLLGWCKSWPVDGRLIASMSCLIMINDAQAGQSMVKPVDWWLILVGNDEEWIRLLMVSCLLSIHVEMVKNGHSLNMMVTVHKGDNWQCC